MTDRAVLIERLKKMRRLVDDVGATEGEVQAALLAIRRISDQYAITEADLKSSTEAGEVTEGWAHEAKTFSAWYTRAARLVAELCDVAMFMRGNRSVYFGHKADVEVAQAFLESFLAIVREMGRVRFSDRAKQRSYAEGFIAGVRAVMQNQPTHAIVLAKRHRLHVLLKETYTLTKGRKQQVDPGQEYWTGHTDGRSWSPAKGNIARPTDCDFGRVAIRPTLV